MHRRLVSYFDRKNCRGPQELADETLSRVARRLEEEGAITGATPAHYCYIVARFVFLEHQRQATALPIETGELAAPAETDAEERAQMLHCLEQCLHRLEPEQREMTTRTLASTVTEGGRILPFVKLSCAALRSFLGSAVGSGPD